MAAFAQDGSRFRVTPVVKDVLQQIEMAGIGNSCEEVALRERSAPCNAAMSERSPCFVVRSFAVTTVQSPVAELLAGMDPASAPAKARIRTRQQGGPARTSRQPAEESPAATALTSFCPLMFLGGAWGAIVETLMRGALLARIAEVGANSASRHRHTDTPFAFALRILAGSRNTRSNSLVQLALLSKPVAPVTGPRAPGEPVRAEVECQEVPLRTIAEAGDSVTRVSFRPFMVAPPFSGGPS